MLSQTSESKSAAVRRLYTENHLFLDLESLSKSFKTILRQFSMIVIARVTSINQEQAGKENPYGLEAGTLFFQCQIGAIENIVGFEGDSYGFTNYAC